MLPVTSGFALPKYAIVKSGGKKQVSPSSPTMSRTGFRAVSQRIGSEKTIKHVGTASIRLDALYFPHSKGLNRENVERLKRLFRKERGCTPGDIPNRIPAIVDGGQLREFLSVSGISAERLGPGADGNHVKLELPPGVWLECLRGRHRVKAAEEALTSRDKRWVVDLFLAGMANPSMNKSYH